MPLPADIHDPDKNYRVRICLLIEDNPLIGFATGSKVHQCDRCGDPVWKNENQVMPEKEGVRIDGDISVCLPCMKALQAEDPNPVEFMGPVPPGFLD